MLKEEFCYSRFYSTIVAAYVAGLAVCGPATALSAGKGRTSTVWLDPCVLCFEENSTTEYTSVSIILNIAVLSNLL